MSCEREKRKLRVSGFRFQVNVRSVSFTLVRVKSITNERQVFDCWGATSCRLRGGKSLTNGARQVSDLPDKKLTRSVFDREVGDLI